MNDTITLSFDFFNDLCLEAFYPVYKKLYKETDGTVTIEMFETEIKKKLMSDVPTEAIESYYLISDIYADNLYYGNEI